MPDDLVLREAARWLRYSREDLASAAALRACSPRNACLLSQQGAEKALKSVYAFLDSRIPRSHDLDLLRNLLPDGWSVKTHFEDLSELSFWAVESRYPGDVPEATSADADAAMVLAEGVVTCIEMDLRANGFRDL